MFLTKIVDAHDNAITLQYDSQLRLTSVTDAIGQSTTFQYDNSNDPLLVTGVTDPFGRNATLGYDSAGRLESITDEVGMTSTFAYDGTGTFIQSMATPYGTTQFVQTVGANGDPSELSIQATGPLGYTERTEYHVAAPGIPYSVPQTPAGMSIYNAHLNYRDSFHWDKDEFAAACSSSSGPVSCDYTKARMQHFLHQRPCCQYTSRYLESVKNPLEGMVWYDYPGQSEPYPSAYPGTLSKPSQRGRVLSDGSTQLANYAYNAQGNLTERTDPDGRETLYTYAPNGIDVVDVQQQDGSALDTIAQYTYNTQHEPLTYTNAAGRTTTYTYNARGQLVSETDPLGNTTSYSYSGSGYLTNITNALGHTAESYTYDANGRIATDTDSMGYTRVYSYDALNRITQITYPDGTTRTFVWNKLDLASATDRQGRTTSYAYDAGRNLIAITTPSGLITRLKYYPSGKLHTMTDPKGNMTVWTRDIEGRVIVKTYADGKGDTYTYDNAGRLVGVTDVLGQITNYTYDPDNLLTGISYANAINPTANVTYRYDAAYPRLLSMVDGIGTTTFTYVPVGTVGALKLRSVAGPFGANDLVGYDYDADGRVTGLNTDYQNDFNYDALGRVSSEINALGTFKNNYLGDTDQLTGRQLIGQSGPGFQLSIAYDDNIGDRQLKSLTYHAPSAPSPERQLSFTHSAEHQVLSSLDVASSSPIGSINTSHTYGYDSDDRLTSATLNSSSTSVYGYDDAGNLLTYQNGETFSASANELNQLSIVNGATWQYDADGNLVNDGQHQYDWDAANRLIKVTSLVTGVVTSYAYDGLGRRLAIGEQNSGGQQLAETHYLWCDDTLCGARDSRGNVIADYYAQGEQQDSYTQAGQRDTANLYYVEDQNGSIVGTMNATGTQLGITSYTEYGAVSQSDGGTADFGYAGMFYDSSTGLYLTRYREYMPAAGRWLNRDPIGIVGGRNVYAYVGDNPTSLVDPSGEIPLPEWVRKWGFCVIALGNLCRPYLHPPKDVHEMPQPKELPAPKQQESGCDSADEKDRKREPEHQFAPYVPTPDFFPLQPSFEWIPAFD